MFVLRSVAVFCFFVALIFENALAHPSELTSSSGCKKPLAVGTSYMGVISVQSTDNSVTVKRGSTTLTSGATYVAGETLTVQITTASNFEYLLQALGGALFTGGKCSNTRMLTTGTLAMPSSGTVTITMVKM